MCFTEIHVLLLFKYAFITYSYHGQHLFISHRFLKSPLEKLIPHAKIHRQSPNKANDRRKFLREEREGKKATNQYGLHTNRAGVPPCSAFTSIVLYYVLQHQLNYFHFQVSFSRSAFRTPPLYSALWLESTLTLQGGDSWDQVSTRSYSNYTEIGLYSL